MKKWLVFTSFVFTFFLNFHLYSSLSEEEHVSDQLIIIPETAVIDKTSYYFGNEAILSGTFEKDVYIACNHLTFNGVIKGNLYVVAMTTDISGIIEGNLNAICMKGSLSGEINRKAYLLGGDINISKTFKVQRQLLSIVGNMRLASGSEQGSLMALAGEVAIGSSIKGNVKMAVGKLNLNKTATVDGNITYWSRLPLNYQKGALVKGQIIQKVSDGSFQEKMNRFLGKSIPAYLLLKLASFVSLFIIGLFLLKFSRPLMYESSQVLRTSPWKSLGIGIVAVVIIPIVILFLLITMVGIPLAVNLLAIYLVHLYIVKIYAIFGLGIYVFKRKSNSLAPWLILLIGLFVYYVITIIPVVGFAITLLALFWGFGAWIITRKHFNKLIKQHTPKSWD